MTRIVPLAGLILLAACAGADSSATLQTSSPDAITWEQFLSVVYQEDDGVYVANGDEPFETLADLREFYDTKVTQAEVGVMRGELAVYNINGTDIKWSSTQKMNLTYCVSTAFGSRYSAVVNAMDSAAGAWEATARINFIHVSNQDSNCTKSNTNVLFDVSPVNSGGRYLARSFFPNTSRRSRNVLIDGTSFTTSAPLTLTGILRHELGHTIGFRHEHTRPEAGTCFEDNNWRALTSYDSGSVMHYPQCNGTGNWSLTLTTKDKAGASSLYP
jgi:hypothetical protein